MGITSYAQNFEDVMLWRALNTVGCGFYIDVGAQHPVIDSVTKAFYDNGWRGVHIEPTVAYATMLRDDRPEDTVLQVALAESVGLLKFFEIPETGISTADVDLAEGYRNAGRIVHEITVPRITLANVFEMIGARDIHWLKIDVEGFERQVLEGWGDASARPWIVVVESTIPMTTVESYNRWENLLAERGYQWAYFDGLNRFYISAEHPELGNFFKSGPNLFDEFSLNGTANAPFCRKLLSHQQSEIEALHRAAERAMEYEQQKIEQLNGKLAERQSGELCSLHDRLNQFDENAQQRESLLNEQLSTIRAELAEQQSGEFHGLHGRLNRFEESVQQREGVLNEQLFTIRAELTNVSVGVAQREQEFAGRVLEARVEAEQKAHLLQMRDDLRLQAFADRENRLNEQLDSARGDQVRLLQDVAARENVWAQQAIQFRKETEALLRLLVQREQQSNGRLTELRDEFERAAAQREQESRARADAVQQDHAGVNAANAANLDRLQRKHEDLLSLVAERTHQFADELVQIHHENQRQLQALNEGHIEAVRIIETQLAFERDRYLEVESASQTRQGELRLQLSERQSTMEALIKAHSDSERLLRDQFVRERQVTQALHGHIRTLRSSFSWRFAVALRSMCRRLRLGPIGGSLDFEESDAAICQIESLTCHVVPQNDPMRQTNNPSVMTYTSSPVSAKSVTELLAHHDRQFVRCAYITLLGRAPDSDGEIYYLGRLQLGYGKTAVLAQIAESTEAKRFAAKLPGLERLIVEQRRARHWFWRAFERGERLERRGNKLEYEFDRMNERLEQLTSNQLKLGTEVRQIARVMNGLLTRSGVTGENVAQDSPSEEQQDVNTTEIDLSELSLPVKRIFVELGKAVEAASVEEDK